MAQRSKDGAPILRPNFRDEHKSGLERAVEQRQGRRKKGISWGNLDPAEIGRFVRLCCDTGNGLVLGITSDGGALSITVLNGNTKIKEYPSSEEDWEDILAWAETSFEGDLTSK